MADANCLQRCVIRLSSRRGREDPDGDLSATRARTSQCRRVWLRFRRVGNGFTGVRMLAVGLPFTRPCRPGLSDVPVDAEIKPHGAASTTDGPVAWQRIETYAITGPMWQFSEPRPGLTILRPESVARGIRTRVGSGRSVRRFHQWWPALSQRVRAGVDCHRRDGFRPVKPHARAARARVVRTIYAYSFSPILIGVQLYDQSGASSCTPVRAYSLTP